MMNPVFSPFPLITTDRLVLRAIGPADADDIYFLRTNEALLRYFDRAPARSMAEVMIYIDEITKGIATNDNILWGITMKGEDTVIGTLGLWKIEKHNYRAEIGYVLRPEYQRQGIMYEALNAAIAYAFDQMGLNSIVANINPDNVASRELLKKLSFTREAYFRQSLYFNGIFLDSEIYTLLSSEYRKTS